jgi:ATP-dependent RNA helicase DeaD
VLVPTRELAMQVAEATHKYARGLSLGVVPVYGGAAMDQQVRALQRGADVVVATPGRALDLSRRRTLALDGVGMLVLDEADEMLDMGFAEDLEALLQATPAERQTALFSATIPPRIAAIGRRHLRDPASVTIARERGDGGALPRVRQLAFVVPRAHKALALGRVLDMQNPSSALVFCRTRIEVDELVETLNAHGYRAEALHGGMAQKQRDRALGAFRSGKLDLLVATDVAARGLDIAHLSHVVNYDVPSAPEAYVHRIGRTGRASRAGVAITLAEPREHRLLRNIEQFTRQKIEIAALPTVADLRSRRLELMMASLRERLDAHDSDEARVVVESLAGEYDLIEIAAAAVKLALDADGKAADEREISRVEPQPARERPSRRPAAKPERRRPVSEQAGRSAAHRDARMAPQTIAERRPAGPAGITRLYVGAGRNAGVRPADLMGAIAAQTGLGQDAVGSIQVGDRFSIVEVPRELAEPIIRALRSTRIRGRKATVNRDRGRRQA